MIDQLDAHYGLAVAYDGILHFNLGFTFIY